MNLFKKLCSYIGCLIIFLCLITTYSSVKAQVVPFSDVSEGTYLQETTNILLPIDKSKIPTGILYDRVFNLAGLERFTGAIGSDTSDIDHFHQAYYELYTSAYNNSGWKTPEQLDADLLSLYPSTTHPIGILYYNYNCIDTNSVTNNLFYIQNGQLYDVVNRTVSPYNNNVTLIASPLGEAEAEWETGIHTFTLDSRFFLTNQSLNINNVSVDFDDGVGYRALTLNSSVQINYTTIGSKIIKMNINLVGGAVLKAISGINIRTGRPNITPCNGYDKLNITGLPFNASQYGGTTTTQATGTAYIYYANANCSPQRITKPIIFLDGFDPKKKKKDNERTHQKIYNEYINKDVTLSNGTHILLGDKLRNDGYDIIIYDYEDGGDLIEKNALAVVQLLQTLYTQHQNTLQDDFVVIGPSYGSLVAQYALAYCEKNNIAHHSRLFISFDGPQQGANVPIGLQQMVDYFLQKGLIGDIFSNAKNGLHRTNAARQMLVHHSIANSETPAPDNFRNIFKSNLTAVGEYPTICRKIAIINGSNDALSNTLLAPCGEMVHFSMNKLISSNKKLNWNCYASAKTNRCESLNMLTDGWLLRKVIGQPKVKILYTQPAANNNSYDAAPGGYFEDTFSEYDGKVRFWAAIAFGWMRKKEYRHNVNATFMPSVSAADIRLPSFNLSYNFKNINLACEGLSPFDRVYAPPINEPHVSITSNNAGWFETEIKGKPGLIPNGSVYDVNISTSATCIDSTPVTLTASSNAGTAVQYIWTVGTELKIVSGQGTSSIQVVKNVPNSTISTVTVSVNSHCGNGTFSKNITVGAPTILTLSGTYTTEGFSAYIDENQSQFCLKSYMFPGFYSGVIALNDQVATNYYWALVSKYPSTATTGIGLVPGTTKDYEVYVKPQNGMATYRLTTANACGSSSRDFTFVADGECLIAYAMQSPASESFTIAPNPADNSFTVILEKGLQSNTETSNTTKTAMDYDIKLYDKNMRELKKAKSKGENVTITIADLPNDIYYLIIKDGKNTVNKQILVQH